jgi:hypothetical protein
LEDLDLEPRTYNCLRNMQLQGKFQQLADLSEKTIGDILRFHGFGAKCLVDLLTSLESAQNSSPHAPDTQRKQQVADEGLPLRLVLSRLRHLRLPKLPEGTKLRDMPLTGRAYNCLQKQGYQERLQELEELTVEQALEIPGFGMQSFLDYLEAVAKLHTEGPTDEPGKPGSDEPLYTPAWTLAVEQRFLEDELRDLLMQGRQPHGPLQLDRNTAIALEYFGFDGGGGWALRAIGDKYGVTRERVRQICDRAVRDLKRITDLPPMLKRTLEYVSQHLPSEATALEAQLQREGLVRTTFRLEGLANAAKLLGQTPPFQIEEIDGRRMAVHAERVRVAKRMIGIARRAVRRFGVVTVDDVAAQITGLSSSVISPEFVARVLEARPDFEWLDKDSGWFWFRSLTKNRVLSRIRKILSVAETIDVSELRSGIARHYMMEGYAPPRRVLLELSKRLPYCYVEGSLIRAQPGLDWQTLLRGTEHTMAKILKEHGPVLQRANFEALCTAEGMKRPTFYAYLDYSPIIERYASGVYGLRGASLPPGLAESLVQHREFPTSVHVDHGWTRDRKLWIGYRVSEAMVRNGVFSVPSGVKNFLQCKFTLKATDGGVVGTLVIRDNSGWGLGPFYRRRGGESGDNLLIVFDLKCKEALISVGDENLLEPYQLDTPRGGMQLWDPSETAAVAGPGDTSDQPRG